MKNLMAVFLGLAVAGCAGTGTRPDDMSAAGHRAAAEEHAAEAKTVTGKNVAGQRAQHNLLAREHAEAGAVVEKHYHVACAGVAEPTSCPLGPALAVDDTPGGIVLHYGKDVGPADALEREANCFHAKSAAVGLDSAGACPLGVRDVTATAASTAAGVDVTLKTREDDQVPELRTRARALARKAR